MALSQIVDKRTIGTSILDKAEPRTTEKTSALRPGGICPALCAIPLLISPLFITMADELLPRFISIEKQGPATWLQIDTVGETNFVVESSEDLENWLLFRGVSATINNIYLLDFQTEEVQRRYFRLIVPGRSAEEMRNAWEERSIESYRFRMKRTCFCEPHRILSATVTVTNGTVVNVEDAMSSGGLPEPNPDMAEFKSVEELFDLIIQSSGEAELVLAAYDETLGYPNYVEIDPDVLGIDEEIRYEVSDLEVLSVQIQDSLEFLREERAFCAPDSR